MRHLVLAKIGAEKVTRTIGRGGIGDHLPGLVKVGAEKFTRTIEWDRS